MAWPSNHSFPVIIIFEQREEVIGDVSTALDHHDYIIIYRFIYDIQGYDIIKMPKIRIVIEIIMIYTWLIGSKML